MAALPMFRASSPLRGGSGAGSPRPWPSSPHFRGSIFESILWRMLIRAIFERVLIEHGRVAHVPGIVAVARRLRRRLAQAVALVAPLSRQHLRKHLVADVDPRHF